jgi:co-chaperonin GroES (HSP10)
MSETTSTSTPVGERDNHFQVGVVGFEALGDRVLVEEDPFVSGYECRACSGHGWNMCAECDEEGHSKTNRHITCKVCAGTRKATCQVCFGKGGLLVVPEKSQRRPTTGTIVSLGEVAGLKKVEGVEVKTLFLGDKVMYGSFAGHVVDLEAQERVIIRILHDTEILCRVSGHLAYRMGE